MPEGSGDVRYDFASTGRANGDLVQTFATGSVFNMNGTMIGIGEACLDNDCTLLFFGGFGESEDRNAMTYQTVATNNFHTSTRIQDAVAFAPVDGTGGHE